MLLLLTKILETLWYCFLVTLSSRDRKNSRVFKKKCGPIKLFQSDAGRIFKMDALPVFYSRPHVLLTVVSFVKNVVGQVLYLTVNTASPPTSHNIVEMIVLAPTDLTVRREITVKPTPIVWDSLQ